MKRIAYHCTNNLEEIINNGFVLPFRMSNVFLFKLKTTAQYYLKEFRCKNIVCIEYDTKDVERTWKPKWSKNEMVIKLKTNEVAKYLHTEAGMKK